MRSRRQARSARIRRIWAAARGADPLSTGADQPNPAASVPARPRRASLRDVGLAAGVVLALAVAYRELLTLGTRYTVESGAEYFLFAPNDRAPIVVLALSAWLAWRRRGRLAALPRRGSPLLAGGLLLLGFAIQSWATYVAAQDLQAVSLMAVCSALLAFGWGPRGLRAMWLPVAFLAFCLPIPAPLLADWLWQLRIFAAEYTGWLLYLISVPALVSGDQILRAEQAFQVIDGCSGLRSMETLSMLVILLIDLFERRGLHAALLLVSAPLVALALNGVRVLTLVMNPHSEIVAIHSLQGIVILLIGLLVVYWLDGLLWRFLQRREPTLSAAPPEPDARAGLLPAAALVAGLGALVVGIATPAWKAPRHPGGLEDLVRGAVPQTDFAPVVIETDPYFNAMMGVRESLHRRYGFGASAVEVFIATADLRDRRGSIITPAASRPGSGWTVRDARIIEVGPEADPVLAQQLEKGLERRVTWSWYLGTASLAEETLRNLAGLERSPFRREQGQLVVRLTTRPNPGDEARTHARLERHFTRLQPALMAAVAPHEPAAAEPLGATGADALQD